MKKYSSFRDRKHGMKRPIITNDKIHTMKHDIAILHIEQNAEKVHKNREEEVNSIPYVYGSNN